MAFEEERQALYEETLLVRIPLWPHLYPQAHEIFQMARDRGLFDPPSYNLGLTQAVDNRDVAWKAWARIQSAQRSALAPSHDPN